MTLLEASAHMIACEDKFQRDYDWDLNLTIDEYYDSEDMIKHASNWLGCMCSQLHWDNYRVQDYHFSGYV